MHRLSCRRLITAIQLVFLTATAVSANISLSNAFSSHAVLQRGISIPIWGKGASGEQVTVSIGTQTKTAVTPSNGSWKVLLDPMVAAGPLTMTVKGNNTVTVTDVYIGEVWQVAGQSNMDTRLSFYPNLADTIKNANVPLLRYFTLRQPGQSSGGQNPWIVVSPTTAADLSATGYFFGKEILKTVNVAVGLVVTAVGGTTINQWMDPATLSANPSITDSDKGTMWNLWVAPAVGYGMKGTIWIQGENDCNAAGSAGYGNRFKLLINGWRAAWGQGEFPFYFGQLSSSSGTAGPNDESYVATVREGQRLALALPGTAMSVNFDIGAGNWHYPEKPEAGRRLSLPAKALLYGQNNIVYSGPLFARKIVDGNRIKLLFTHTGGGLIAKNGTLSGFAVAPASGSFVWGTATISGDTVIVSSASVATPARVRYGWSNVPAASLYNKEGLPASPFSTESPDLPTGTLTVLPVAPAASHTAPARCPASASGSGKTAAVDALGKNSPLSSQRATKILWCRSAFKNADGTHSQSNVNAVNTTGALHHGRQ
jgi:sialate O-acetylesterase